MLYRQGELRALVRRVAALVVLLCCACAAHASVALLMEEPFGSFGAFNPTGHAAVYLNHICAATPTQLRRCDAGEPGVVISRYHKINHEDWIAIPLVPYLYAVTSVADVPKSATKADVKRLREDYWAAHLQALAPAKQDGLPPGGEWTQLVGSSFDRKIHGFQADTTQEEDDRLIAYFNDRRDVSHFNLFFHNCADFSRVVLDTYFPHAIHRNFVADLGLTTPKQVAKSLVKYGRKNPGVNLTPFTIPQVPGEMPRSHRVDGVAESIVRSKKYMIPLAFFQPEFAGALAVSYLSVGRLHLPKDTPIFDVDDLATEQATAPTGNPVPAPAQASAPAQTAAPDESSLMPRAQAAAIGQ